MIAPAVPRIPAEHSASPWIAAGADDAAYDRPARRRPCAIPTTMPDAPQQRMVVLVVVELSRKANVGVTDLVTRLPICGRPQRLFGRRLLDPLRPRRLVPTRWCRATVTMAAQRRSLPTCRSMAPVRRLAGGGYPFPLP